MLADSQELDYLILCPSNVYGRLNGKRHNQGFIELAVSNVLERQPITVWGTGKQTRDYIHISDLTDLVKRIIVKKINKEMINLAYGKSYDLLTILEIIEKQVDMKPSIIYKDPDQKQINTIKFDTSFLKSKIQFDLMDIETGIKKYIQEYTSLNINNE